MSEKMDELQGLAEDLGKLSWTSREFGETIKVMLEKAKEANRVIEDLEISVAKVEKLYKTEEVYGSNAILTASSSSETARYSLLLMYKQPCATHWNSDRIGPYISSYSRTLGVHSAHVSIVYTSPRAANGPIGLLI
ncbi:hypothetical protein RHGRI_035846 [Rhododendron griersonianum]|uniref:Uncharacterized protein n=1 Tax=Rhododendron griersonianum TaxID=479676 RepID=A0AAV6HKS5_9ERIC|nr:hypothetical protein RHGRI_035846 [Rhododendron griersonianum]